MVSCLSHKLIQIKILEVAWVMSWIYNCNKFHGKALVSWGELIHIPRGTTWGVSRIRHSNRINRHWSEFIIEKFICVQMKSSQCLTCTKTWVETTVHSEPCVYCSCLELRRIDSWENLLSHELNWFKKFPRWVGSIQRRWVVPKSGTSWCRDRHLNTVSSLYL